MKKVAGFLLAGLILVLLTSWIGWGETIATISKADLLIFSLGAVSTSLALTFWSLVLKDFLEVQDEKYPLKDAILVYFSGIFANYVTPLGQAGGEPLIALILSKNSEFNYEECYATVLSLDTFNMIPFFTFSLIGLTYFLTRSTLTSTLRWIIYGSIFLLVFIIFSILFVWFKRERVENITITLLSPFRKIFSLISLQWYKILSPESLKDRIDNFYGTLDLIASNRSKLVTSFGYSFLGWFFFALPLFFALRSLSLQTPFLLIFLIVPLASMAGLIPLPGGLGGVEFGMTALLTGIAGLTAPQAYSATLLYRIASYWFGILAGGLAMIYLTRQISYSISDFSSTDQIEPKKG